GGRVPPPPAGDVNDDGILVLLDDDFLVDLDVFVRQRSRLDRRSQNQEAEKRRFPDVRKHIGAAPFSSGDASTLERFRGGTAVRAAKVSRNRMPPGEDESSLTLEVVSPRIRGFICTNAHPTGCAASVAAQVARAESQSASFQAGGNALIVGASTGYGLASWIVAAFARRMSSVGLF